MALAMDTVTLPEYVPSELGLRVGIATGLCSCHVALSISLSAQPLRVAKNLAVTTAGAPPTHTGLPV